MLGIKIEQPWTVAAEELPMPEPAAGEALIRVKAAGICGSDIGAFRGTNPLVSYPRVIGHEIAGEIVSVPDGCTSLKPGDRVIADPYLYCGDCYPCSLKRTNCCVDLHVLGVHCEGGMAEYFAHPADMLVKVPDDMDWSVIPMAEPLTIALHGIHRAKLSAGEHIAISGAGPIGLLAAMAALHYGAVPIVIDPVEERLQLAAKLGITHTVCLGKDEPVEKIRQITSGRMAEVVMEASGADSAVSLTLDIVSFAGRVILTGWPKHAISLDTAKITKKELDIRGARTSAGEFEEAVKLIYDGVIDVHALLATAPFQDAPEIIKDMEKNPGKYMKVNVIF